MGRPTSSPRTAHDATLALGPDRAVALGDELGRGSSAAVFRGLMLMPYGLRRAVAVKVFDVVASDERDYVISALGRAARRAAFVRHPNVVETYEYAVVRGTQPVIVSELVHGRPLATLLDAYVAARRRVPPDVGLFVVTEVAEALAAAREARTPEGARLNLAHHDFSPRDVLLSWNGEVKVSDFGIGPATRPASAVRSVRSLARRASTMAPEVACGGRTDGRADVFALGVILREMLVAPRFPPGIGDAQAFAMAREGYVHVPMFEPRLPSHVADIVKRALEIDPDDRWPHAAALAYELRRACWSMGVGDGRIFLRQALHEMLAEDDPDATKRIPAAAASGPAPAVVAETDGESAEDPRTADQKCVHRITRPDPEEL